jgi:predicted alpha/beta hydrolase
MTAAAENTSSRSIRFAARDGVSLAGTWHLPSGPIISTAIIAPATAVPARFYAPFAAFLAKHGVAVLVPDYRGIGASRDPALHGHRLRRFSAGFASWARLDLAAACDEAIATYPDRPFVYFGHSLGGQVFPLVPAASRASAAVFIASQIGWVGHWRSLPTLPRYLGLMATLGLSTATLGYGLGRIFGGEDLPRGAAIDWGAWALHPRYLAGWHADALARAAAIAIPMAFVRFTDDLDFAPAPAVEALMEWYPRAERTAVVCAPAEFGLQKIGHFGFFRPAHGPALWPQVATWLAARHAASPPPTSGACA